MIIALRTLQLKVPPKEMFMQWSAHMTYISLGIYFLGLYREPIFYLTCLAICGIMELFASFYRSQYKAITLPITGFISAGTFFLFVESPFIQIYIMGAVLAILSKYLIRYNGKHVFNPGNIAILLTIILLPQYAVSVPGQWGGEIWLIILVGLIGMLVSSIAGRILLSVSYIGAFILFSCVRAYYFDISPFFLAGTVIGVPGMIYAFHFITDPVTTPNTRKSQILFGVAIAGLDVYLRYIEVLYAPLIACAVITAMRPIINEIQIALKK